MWGCVSHVNCPHKIKVVASEDGYNLFCSTKEHASERAALPANFKGISAEFDGTVKELAGQGHKPNRIRAELIMQCGADESKKGRVPTKQKIAARCVALSASPAFQFETFADLMLWANDKRLDSKEAFAAEQDLDKVIVLSTFSFEIEIDDDSEGAPKGAKIATTTFGFVASSKRILLQFRDVRYCKLQFTFLTARVYT